jgi:hypothetical protein
VLGRDGSRILEQRIALEGLDLAFGLGLVDQEAAGLPAPDIPRLGPVA